ncbi:MAG: hypothetical protein JWN33_501 [Candidatus Saccharibacteria bacterium]|nr:hypothetical protein [Candidatus Saccharibacteria bacterium]
MEKISPDTISQRRIVSYFEHEFGEMSLASAFEHVEEMKEAGFTNVILCVTESDIDNSARQEYLRIVKSLLDEQGIEVWADPWGVGSVFGGEGISHFKNSGEKSCYCNPNLDVLIKQWIETVQSLEIDTIFWDEPEMKCDDHRDDELKFIERYTAVASELNFNNVVCLTANRKKHDQFELVASMPNVAEIAVDPYYPNAFEVIAEADRLAYITEWVETVQDVAERNDKRSHVWVQNFNIPLGRESIVREHIDICRHHLADVAIWGFRGCVTVPNFASPAQVQPIEIWDYTKQILAEHREPIQAEIN